MYAMRIVKLKETNYNTLRLCAVLVLRLIQPEHMS